MGYVRSDYSKHYDHRYLYVGDLLKAGCICGVASDVVAEILMELNSGLFLESDWVNYCETLTDNPAVQGLWLKRPFYLRLCTQA